MIRIKAKQTIPVNIAAGAIELLPCLTVEWVIDTTTGRDYNMALSLTWIFWTISLRRGHRQFVRNII